MPTVLITGGTGLIGSSLTKHLVAKGYEVIILSRDIDQTYQNTQVTFAKWNIEKGEIDATAIRNSDYIINLAGAGVMDKKWTKKYKKEIVESRTKSSDLIVKSLKDNTNHVKGIVSASAIGWYGEDLKPPRAKNGDGEMNKSFIETAAPDKKFLGETCRLWEQSIEPVTDLNKRLVKLRIGIVLSNDGAAFAEFKKPLRFGIAAILGSGKQIISWVHIDDLCRMFIYAIENETMQGSYNAVAPVPVNNKNLILQLAQKIKGQFYIPVYIPNFILKLFLGDRSIEILKSATVSCEKIKATGFTFLYPTIDASLKELTLPF